MTKRSTNGLGKTKIKNNISAYQFSGYLTQRKKFVRIDTIRLKYQYFK